MCVCECECVSVTLTRQTRQPVLRHCYCPLRMNVNTTDATCDQHPSHSHWYTMMVESPIHSPLTHSPTHSSTHGNQWNPLQFTSPAHTASTRRLPASHRIHYSPRGARMLGSNLKPCTSTLSPSPRPCAYALACGLNSAGSRTFCTPVCRAFCRAIDRPRREVGECTGAASRAAPPRAPVHP